MARRSPASPRHNVALRAPSPALATDLRLIELATEHVRRHGAARLAITEIAGAAGMSHANVYRYFRSKAALVEAISAAWLAPLEASLRVIADAPDPAYDKLERLIFAVHRAYRDKAASDPRIFDLFCTATAAQADVARKHQHRIARAIHRILDEGHGSGTYAINDQDAAVGLVTDTMYRFLSPIAVRADIGNAPSELENRAALALRLVSEALAKGEL
jgi:AcrR family transcriptional regulator